MTVQIGTLIPKAREQITHLHHAGRDSMPQLSHLFVVTEVEATIIGSFPVFLYLAKLVLGIFLYLVTVLCTVFNNCRY